jgi:hypothetical protein
MQACAFLHADDVIVRFCKRKSVSQVPVWAEVWCFYCCNVPCCAVLWLPYLHQKLLRIKREGPEVHGSRVGCQHTAPLKDTVPCSTKHSHERGFDTALDCDWGAVMV